MSTSAASPSSSSSSAFSSESASTTAAPPPPPPHAPSGLLSEQLWYWPGADRAAVANALLAAPDGSFIVRDASTPGDYTLCIKFEGNTKLVKINVGKNGQCGFAPDALNHRDVMSLIAHHRANSLSYYNEKLDTKLLYPVERLRELQRGASTEESGGEQHRHSIELCETDAELMALRLHDPPAEWKRRILLERFLTACAAAGRTARIYDALHGQILHADAIVAECDKRITDYDLKAERLDEAIVRRNLHQMKQNERKDSVCSTIESRSQSDSVHGRSTAEPQLAGRSESDADAVRRGISLKANAQALMRLATMLKHERAKATAQCDEVKGAREELREALNATRVRLEKNANTCSRMEVKLLQAGFSQAQLHEEGEKIRALVLNEQHEMAESLDHLPPTWDPAAFYTQTRSKDVAARLIRRAWLKKRQEQSDDGDGSGIFLVRPSGSLAGRFVLSVLHGGERVSHCLITLHEVGWGFEKSGRYFCTLTDLVRFYSHVSLATHNPEIQTKLTRPALEAR